MPRRGPHYADITTENHHQINIVNGVAVDVDDTL